MVNKEFINSLPELYDQLGEKRFWLKVENNQDINNLADIVLARTGVLPGYRKEYKDEYNHLLALDKSIKQFKKNEGGSSFWTYLNLVMGCSVIDFARKKATAYKKYIATDDITSAVSAIDEYNIDDDLTNKQLEANMWKIINSQMSNLFTEIVKLSAAGYTDRDIRKMLKIKQTEIDSAKSYLYKLYEIEL